MRELTIISGLYAFASTTLILSLYNVHARHIDTPNAVVGMALFYGGLGQLLAGMWEFATGNTFGATGGSNNNYFNFLLPLVIPCAMGGVLVYVGKCDGYVEHVDYGRQNIFRGRVRPAHSFNLM